MRKQFIATKSKTMMPPTTSGSEINNPESADGNRIDPTGPGVQYDLYQLLMLTPAGIVLFSGPDFIVEFANDRYLSIAGKTRAALWHKPAREAIPAASRQCFIELLDVVRATGEPRHLHEHQTLLERNGRLETLYLNIMCQPVKEATDAVSKIMVLVTDVTEQVTARKNAGEGENKFRILIENSHDVICLTDENQIISYISPSVKRVFGYAEEELLGRNGPDFMHPDDVAVVANEAANIGVPNGSMVQTVRFRHKNGTWRWIERTVTNLLHMPHLHAFVSTMRDITEQKEAAEKTKKEAGQFRMLADSISQLAWMATADGWIYWYNQRWYDSTLR